MRRFILLNLVLAVVLVGVFAAGRGRVAVAREATPAATPAAAGVTFDG